MEHVRCQIWRESKTNLDGTWLMTEQDNMIVSQEGNPIEYAYD